MSSVGSTRSASRYRQRYGRGGRVYIDRTLTAGEKEELEKAAPTMSALEERLRFDPRLSADEKPIALDEFSIEYTLAKMMCSNLQSNLLSGETSPSTSNTKSDHPNQHRQYVESPYSSSSTCQ